MVVASGKLTPREPELVISNTRLRPRICGSISRRRCQTGTLPSSNPMSLGPENDPSGVNRCLVPVTVRELFGLEEQLPDRAQKQLVLDEEDHLLLCPELLQGGEYLLNSMPKQGVASLLADYRSNGSGRAARLRPADALRQVE